MRSRSHHPWWLAPAARVFAGLLLALGATWRLRRLRMDEVDRALAGGERCIFALWHCRMLPLVLTHRGRGVAMMVSRHRDGEWIARVIQALGYCTARGSSTRGGEEALREMLELASRGHLLGITPDGPRGPRERVKPGLIYLAQRTGWPVLPVTSSARDSWVMRSWDGFRVPRPFARTVVAYGPMIHVPAELTRDEIPLWQERIERALSDLTREAALLSGEAEGS